MPEIPKATVAITIKATAPGPTPPSPVKTANNMESRMKAAARPTDHLPKELFGRILIRTSLMMTNRYCQAVGCYDAVEAHKRFSPVDGLR